jgi:hypothetical protein
LKKGNFEIRTNRTMKRTLQLFLALTVLLFCSCTSDSPAPIPPTVVALIDGVETHFNTINVDQETYTDGDHTYTDLKITASIDNSPNLRLSFVIEKYVTGPQAFYYFAYFFNETAHDKLPGFLLDVTSNTGHHVKGTFSGQVQADDEAAEIADIEEGTFDIVY